MKRLPPCPWPGCEYPQDERLHVCYPHWLRLPEGYRNNILENYREGWAAQPMLYQIAVRAAVKWISDHIHGKLRGDPLPDIGHSAPAIEEPAPAVRRIVRSRR